MSTMTPGSSNIQALRDAESTLRVARDELFRRASAAIASTTQLGSLNPFLIPWSPFSALGSVRETAFTQALAYLLQSDGLDGKLRVHAWNALVNCVAATITSDEERAAAERVLRPPPSPGSIFAEHSETLEGDEANDASNRIRPDIVVSDESRYVIIELKLWGTWNSSGGTGDAADRARNMQNERYRRLAVQRTSGRNGEREIRVIHIGVQRESAEGWLSMTWSDLAIELRRKLALIGEEHGADSVQTFIGATPMLFLSLGIERDLLNLPYFASNHTLDASEFQLDPTWGGIQGAFQFLDFSSRSLSKNTARRMNSEDTNLSANPVALEYARLYESLMGGHRAFVEAVVGTMTAVDGLIRSELSRATLPLPERCPTGEGDGFMFGYYWARVRKLMGFPELAYSGFWAGFVSPSFLQGDQAGTHDLDEVNPTSSLTFRADLWFEARRGHSDEELRKLLDDVSAWCSQSKISVKTRYDGLGHAGTYGGSEFVYVSVCVLDASKAEDVRKDRMAECVARLIHAHRAVWEHSS